MHDDLHWLTVPQRMQYKRAVTVHRCLQHRASIYLTDYCVPVSEVPIASIYDLSGVVNQRRLPPRSWGNIPLPVDRPSPL